MKREFSYNEWEIKSHAGLYYLFKDGVKKARADNIKVLKSYIDGVMYGHEEGSKEWFDKYMALKMELKQLKKVV